jgi:beta-phosphoglucomutase-like phosphatase (HAD superfamily)
MKKLLAIIILTICSSSAFCGSSTIHSNTHRQPLHIIFKYDGVLFDTETLKFQAWHNTVATYNIKLTVKEYKSVAGCSTEIIANHLTKKYPQLKQQALLAKHEAIYAEIKNTQHPSPIMPAIKFLKKLIDAKQKRAIYIYLIASEYAPHLLDNMKAAGIEMSAFSKSYNNKDTNSKNKANVYKQYVRSLKSKQEVFLIFENNSTGVIAAANEGFKVIAMPDQFTNEQDFSQAKHIGNFDMLRISELDQYRSEK